jgi:thiamine-phosphate pyrophosphorylase
MRGLYAILDLAALDARSLDVVAAAQALVEAKPACLQLRAKGVGARRTLECLRAIRPIAARGGVPFFANDRPDLALLAGCDGVHLGQEDVPPGLAKDLAERTERALLVGRSTHDEAQLVAALDEPIDYVAIGPVFATPSKLRHDPVLGVDGARALARIARRTRPDLPVCAIGGLDPSTARALASDFDLVAVIGALVDGATSPADVGARARAFADLHGAARAEASA